MYQVITLLVMVSSLAYGGKLQLDQQQFIAKIKPIAVEVGAKYGIPASAIVGQAIYESGYGRSYLAKTGNNYFGVKAFKDWKGNRIASGGSTYRRYTSMRESITDYARFLKKTRYAPAYKYGDGPRFVQAIAKLGYCPDAGYAKNVGRIIQRFRLNELDA